jgi:hypothetical protein
MLLQIMDNTLGAKYIRDYTMKNTKELNHGINEQNNTFPREKSLNECELQERKKG